MRISCEDHRLLGRFLCRRPSERRPHLRLTAKRGRRMSTKHLPKLCPTLEFDVFLRISMDFYKNHADSITFPGFFLSFSLSVPWTFARSFLSGRPGPSRAVPRRWKSAPSSPSKTTFKGFFSWSRPQVGTDRWWVECRLSEFSYTEETFKKHIYIYKCVYYTCIPYMYTCIYTYTYTRDIHIWYIRYTQYNDIYTQVYIYIYMYIICTIIHIFREIQIELGQIMKLHNQPLFLCKNMGIDYICARNPVE